MESLFPDERAQNFESKARFNDLGAAPDRIVLWRLGGAMAPKPQPRLLWGKSWFL
jgi:hypothetical protein